MHPHNPVLQPGFVAARETIKAGFTADVRAITVDVSERRRIDTAAAASDSYVQTLAGIIDDKRADSRMWAECFGDVAGALDGLLFVLKSYCIAETLPGGGPKVRLLAQIQSAEKALAEARQTRDDHWAKRDSALLRRAAP